MSDQAIAAIARRLAVAASVSGYQRDQDSKKEFLATLTELCAAVKAEAAETGEQKQ